MIPSIAKNNIIEKLQKIGINQSFIMPSLDSLCRDIVYIHKMRYPHGIKWRMGFIVHRFTQMDTDYEQMVRIVEIIE